MTLALLIRVTSMYRFCRQKKHLKDCFYKSIKKYETMGSFYTASEKQGATMREMNDKWLSTLYISFQKTHAQEKKQPTDPSFWLFWIWGLLKKGNYKLFFPILIKAIGIPANIYPPPIKVDFKILTPKQPLQKKHTLLLSGS